MPKGLFLWQSEAGKYLKFRGPLKFYAPITIVSRFDIYVLRPSYGHLEKSQDCLIAIEFEVY